MKRHNNLTLVAYDAIKEMMMRHDIAAGQRLILVDLAEKLGVSRTPVNNALSILAKEGFLEFVPNQGYSVRRFSQKEAEELFEAKETLEICTIAKAIRRMTEERLALLEKTKLAYENAIFSRGHRRLFIFDAEFHADIMAMTGNQYLVHRYLEIGRMISLRFRIDDLDVNRLQAIADDHNELFEAIRIRDVESARVMLARHHANDRRISLLTSIARIQYAKPYFGIRLAT